MSLSLSPSRTHFFARCAAQFGNRPNAVITITTVREKFLLFCDGDELKLQMIIEHVDDKQNVKESCDLEKTFRELYTFFE